MSAREWRHVLIFTGFILLGGVVHLLEYSFRPWLDSLFYCIDFVIYAGLMVYWILSVRRRLLPNEVRYYLMRAAECLMLLFCI